MQLGSPEISQCGNQEDNNRKKGLKWRTRARLSVSKFVCGRAIDHAEATPEERNVKILSEEKCENFE